MRLPKPSRSLLPMKSPSWLIVTLVLLFTGAVVFRRIVHNNNRESAILTTSQPTIEKVGITYLPAGRYVITQSFGVKKVENSSSEMQGLIRVSPINNPSKQIDVEWYEPVGIPYIYNVGVIIEKNVNSMNTVSTAIK